MRLALVCATLVLFWSLSLSGAAHADTYCVAPATGCDAPHTTATVQAALTAAATNPGADTIQLGATTYAQDGMTYTGGDPVSLVGAGTGSTILRRASAAGSSYVLHGTGSGAVSLSHVKVHLLFVAASTVTGLRLDGGGALDDVTVDADAGSYNPTGVMLDGTSSLTNSTIDIPRGGACVYAGSGSVTITGDAMRNCGIAVNSQGATTLVRYVRIADTGTGIDTGSGGGVTVEDSILTFSASGNGLMAAGSGAAANLTANHVTLVGSGAGIGVKSFNHATTNATTVTLHDSIVRGFATSLLRDAAASDPANLNADYNDYAVATATSTGPGTFTSTHVYNDIDPQFVGAAGGDYRLAAGSPLIDQDPTPLGVAESATDFGGNVRIIGPARDLGAFERPVNPTATTGAATAITTTSATISGIVNPGGGAATWHLVYGGGLSTPNADLAPSIADQPVSVQLTGLAPGTTYHYSIVAGNSSGTASGADLTFTTASPPSPGALPPVLSALKLAPKSFAARKGSTLTYKLSAAAKVTFRVRRLVPGVRSGKRCVAARRGRKGGKRCTRAIAVKGSLTRNSVAGANKVHFSGRFGGHLLGRGSYRLTATPAGGRAVSVTFKIVRR